MFNGSPGAGIGAIFLMRLRRDQEKGLGVYGSELMKTD